MELDTLLRKVKRQFGDEYGIIINDQDVIDWCNESQTDIVRSTSSNDVTLSIPANTFPYTPSNRIAVKRVVVNNRPLTQTSMTALDDNNVDLTQNGTPAYWYFADGVVGLWPDPASADLYNVLLTYAVVPTELTLLAPYFQFTRVPAVGQLASTPYSVGLTGTSLNISCDIVLDNLSAFFVVSSGTGLAAATLNWSLEYNGNFILKHSNGTTIRTATWTTFPYPTYTGPPILNVPGMRMRFRVTFNSFNGETKWYYIDPVTKVETLSQTIAGTAENVGVVAAPITIGGYNAVTAVAGGPFKLYYFDYGTDVANNDFPTYCFNGLTDLDDLPFVGATPMIINSGHTLNIVGTPSIQVRNPNELTIPPLYHEDVVKYCIARAHDKNMNYKGAEVAMEAYNQNVSVRRNEADSVDGPQYKINDSSDFSGDWWYN